VNRNAVSPAETKHNIQSAPTGLNKMWYVQPLSGLEIFWGGCSAGYHRRLFTFAPVGGGWNTISVNGYNKIDSYLSATFAPLREIIITTIIIKTVQTKILFPYREQLQ
jgi:hypothetical protein